MRELGIGIVGGGFMGRTWAECARLGEPTSLRAVFGGRRAAGLAADYAIPEEPSMAALLARPDIDAVVVTSPPNAHPEQVALAAEAGKHVLVEKPLARDSASGQRMVDACDGAGVTLAVVAQHRFRSAQLRARELIEDGAIGTLRMVRLSGINAWWDFAAYDDAWKIDPDQMNVFHDWGSHACDILRFQIAAEPVRVVAESTSYTEGPPHQSVMAIYTFANDVLASLWMTYEVPEPRFESAITLLITGSDGILEVDSYRGVRIGRASTWQQDFLERTFDPHRQDDPVRLEAYLRELTDFAAACASGAAPKVTGSDGVRGLRMLEATLTAAGTRAAAEL
jgi:predicted dehydrogenase